MLSIFKVRYIILFILIIMFFINGFFIYEEISREDYNPVKEEIEIPTVIEEIKPILPQETDPESPDIINAIYLTGWSAANPAKIDYAINIAKTTEINAVVVDIKDWSGRVAYDTQVSEAEKYGAERKIIPDIKALLGKFKKEGIYMIARIAVFQDPILASARPDLAVHQKINPSANWLDNSGLAWIDPTAADSWNYNIAIAKDALSQGFDEVNFDYIRFPSDGNFQNMSFPFWDGVTQKSSVIREFFRYLRGQLPQAVLSVDLFGLTTVNKDDLGVGQIIEDGYENFDYICPMVYPSHYASGFKGYENPADYPYEVIEYSMQRALKRMKEYNKVNQKSAKLRPWIQDFDLGAEYNKEQVRLEIDAVSKVLGEDFFGFMVWNSENIYTTEAFSPEN